MVPAEALEAFGRVHAAAAPVYDMADIFADPNLQASASYTPPSGSPVSCMALLRRPDVVQAEQTLQGVRFIPSSR